MKKQKINLISLTTDPYDNIYGYALVFIKLMDYMQKTQKKFNVVLISNDGVSSSKVNNPAFHQIKLKKDLNLIFKTFLLSFFFIKKALSYPPNSIVLANCEIPELIAAVFLKTRFKKVYCIIQDTRVRDNKLVTRAICSLRVFLLNRIDNVIFTNKFTFSNFEGNISKFYIGNPIFN